MAGAAIGIPETRQSIARRYKSSCESGTSTRFETGETRETPLNARYVIGRVKRVAIIVAQRVPRIYKKALRNNFFALECVFLVIGLKCGGSFSANNTSPSVAEKDIQNMTDKYIGKIEDAAEKKTKEILSV